MERIDDKIHKISDKLKADVMYMMTHKEFRLLVKSSLLCRPIKRKRAFECKMCKRLRALQRRF